MSDSAENLNRKISSAGDLQSIVRSMKALAAASIGQYEKSVQALDDYYHTVELGLGACFRQEASVAQAEIDHAPTANGHSSQRVVGAVVFGSDQGLVGQFNDVVADYSIGELSRMKSMAEVWAVGDRVHARLSDAGIVPTGILAVPSSAQAITALVGQILVDSETNHGHGAVNELYVYYNRRTAGSVYEPVGQRILPLDTGWRRAITAEPWPTKSLPEVLGTGTTTLRALVRGYIFISLFRACAESLASENASRLSAMERADKNIQELLATLEDASHLLRQNSIDEELFDVIAGFEALNGDKS